jgi:hypothetical protein
MLDLESLLGRKVDIASDGWVQGCRRPMRSDAEGDPPPAR